MIKGNIFLKDDYYMFDRRRRGGGWKEVAARTVTVSSEVPNKIDGIITMKAKTKVIDIFLVDDAIAL
jgi:hypothetical protein